MRNDSFIYSINFMFNLAYWIANESIRYSDNARTAHWR